MAENNDEKTRLKEEDLIIIQELNLKNALGEDVYSPDSIIEICKGENICISPNQALKISKYMEEKFTESM